MIFREYYTQYVNSFMDTRGYNVADVNATFV